MNAELEHLTQQFDEVLNQAAKPLYLVVDEAHRLLSVSGDSTYYGLGDLLPGSNVSETLAFLVGADRQPGTPFLIELVETPSGKAANIHVFALPRGWGIAYLDATRERDELQRRQQATNELALLHQRRERLLQELEEARGTLERKNRELEEATRLRSLFIGRMSHEFRTPLSSILGYTELLLEELEEQPVAQSRLAAIQRGGRYLLNLVDNLLDQAQLEHEELRLHPSACDLRSMARELEEMFRPVARHKHISLEWQFHGDLPERVWLDELRLRQILVNLLGNAFKFTQAGKVTVELDWRDGRLRLAVTDTGPGVPLEAQSRLFEAFQQVGGDRSTSKGVGLGLSISRALVRRMGGDLCFAPHVGGSRLELAVQAPARTGPPPGTAEPLRGAQVLVVDDDEDILALLRLYLNAAGTEVQLARNAEQALTRVAEAPPQLVLMDLQLGERRGSDVAMRMRETGFTRPIVIMSAADDAATREHLSKTGVEAFLTKPLRRNELIERLAALLA